MDDILASLPAEIYSRKPASDRQRGARGAPAGERGRIGRQMGKIWKCSACDYRRTDRGGVSAGLRAETSLRRINRSSALKAGEHTAPVCPPVGVSTHSIFRPVRRPMRLCSSAGTPMRAPLPAGGRFPSAAFRTPFHFSGKSGILSVKSVNRR